MDLLLFKNIFEGNRKIGIIFRRNSCQMNSIEEVNEASENLKELFLVVELLIHDIKRFFVMIIFAIMVINHIAFNIVPIKIANV